MAQQIDWKQRYLDAQATISTLQQRLAQQGQQTQALREQLLDEADRDRFTQLVTDYNRIFEILATYGISFVGNSVGDSFAWVYLLHEEEVGDYASLHDALAAVIERLVSPVPARQH